MKSGEERRAVVIETLQSRAPVFVQPSHITAAFLETGIKQTIEP